MPTEPTIAAGWARALLDLAVSKGAGREALLERSGISAAELRDQDNRVPFGKYVALMRAGKELCREPALALHFGEAYECGDISIIGHIGGTSATLADAFAQLNRYSRLASDVPCAGPDRFVLARRAGQLWMVDTRLDANDFPEHTESTFARMVSTSRRRFGDVRMMKAVHFTHAAPAHRAEYERVFQLPVVFGSDQNALLLEDSGWMRRPPPHPSVYVSGILRAHADELLGRLEQAQTTRGRVEGVLKSVLHTGEANVSAVAARLGLSRQTLYRRLKTEGVTFARVLDELRHAMALHYLRGRKVSVNETAYLVGFSDPAAFSRAFKRWTGSSPRARQTPEAEHN